MRHIQLGSLFADRVSSIDPQPYPSETFELWSIPAFDAGKPDIALGSSIGSTKKCVEPNDVLLSKIIPHIRRATVVRENRGIRQIASSEWMIFRSPDFWPAYLRHVLISDRFHEQFMNTTAGVGGSLVRARPDAVAKINIPLPPLDEQRQIAALLDQAEDLRRKRRLTLGKLSTLPQAILHDMFGDPATNPKRWATVSLGDLIVNGPQNGIYKPASDYGSGTAILRIDSFYDGSVTRLKHLKRVRLSDGDRLRYALRPDDLVINRVNSLEFLGKSAIIPNLTEPSVFESNMMRVSVDRNRIEPRYLIEFLQTQFIKSQILRAAKNAVNQSSINQADVRSLSIRVPPLVSQLTFVRQCAALESLRPRLERSHDRLSALSASLQHHAFAGTLASLSDHIRSESRVG